MALILQMIRATIVNIIAFVALISVCIGQEQAGWMKTFGGSGDDVGTAIVQLADSGYLIAGLTHSFGGMDDTYVIRVDESGNELFQVTFFPGRRGIPYQMELNGIGNILMGGEITDTFGFNRRDMYLLKLDTVANIKEFRTYGSEHDERYGVFQQTSDSGFIISGMTSNTGNGYDDFYAVKANAIWDTSWTTIIGTTLDEVNGYPFQLKGGGYILVGLTWKPISDSIYTLVVKIKSNGDSCWLRIEQDKIKSQRWAIMTSDNNIITTGTKLDSLQNQGIYLKKFDQNANLLWEKVYGGSMSEDSRHIWETKEKGFVICGLSTSYGIIGDEDLYLVKTDSMGNLLWQRTYGGSEFDYAWRVKPTFDGGYIIVGQTESFGAGNKDVFVVKTDSIGCIWYPGADFVVDTNIIFEDDTIFFTDSSKVFPEDSVVSWLWDFGDGSTSTLTDPWHIFRFADTFSVELTVSNYNGCSHSSQQSIIVKDKPNQISTPSGLKHTVKVYPNPSIGLIQIEVPSDLRHLNGVFTLFNIEGQRVLQTTVTGKHRNDILLSRNAFSAGTYLYKLELDNQMIYTGKVELIR